MKKIKKKKRAKGLGIQKISARKQRSLAMKKRIAQLIAMGLSGAPLVAEPIADLTKEQLVRLNRYRRRVGQRKVPCS